MSVSGALTGVPPVAGVAVAVLTSPPVAVGSICTVKLKLTLAPTGRLTVVDRAPVPLVGPVTVPPLVSVTVQVAAVTPADSGSNTVAPLAALGPALLTTIV